MQVEDGEAGRCFTRRPARRGGVDPAKFMAAVLSQVRTKTLSSDEHSSVDGTPIAA